MRPLPLLITVVSVVASIWAVFLSDRPFYTEDRTYYAKGCSEDWHACKDNADLMEHWEDLYKVQTECEARGKSLVLYGQSHWGRDGWLSGFPFASYMAGDDMPQRGVLSLYEKNVGLQNQYGTIVHRRAMCVYNLKKMKVVSLSILPEENAPGGLEGEELIRSYEAPSARLKYPHYR